MQRVHRVRDHTSGELIEAVLIPRDELEDERRRSSRTVYVLCALVTIILLGLGYELHKTANLADSNHALTHSVIAESRARRAKIAQSDLELCQNVYGNVAGALVALIAGQEQQVTFQFYRSALPSLSDKEIANLVRIARNDAEREKSQLHRAFDVRQCADLPSQHFGKN